MQPFFKISMFSIDFSIPIASATDTRLHDPYINLDHCVEDFNESSFSAYFSCDPLR